MLLALLRRSRERAFTLIELLVVILILGILLAVALPTFLGQNTKAKNSSVETTLTNARLDVKSEYTAANGSYTQWVGAEGTFAAKLNTDEPQYTFASMSSLVGNPQVGVIGVSANSASSVTVCSYASTATAFCLRSDERGALAQLAGDTGASGVMADTVGGSVDVVYATGQAATDAKCVVDSAAGGPTSCATGQPGWGTPVTGNPSVLIASNRVRCSRRPGRSPLLTPLGPISASW